MSNIEERLDGFMEYVAEQLADLDSRIRFMRTDIDTEIDNLDRDVRELRSDVDSITDDVKAIESDVNYIRYR